MKRRIGLKSHWQPRSAASCATATAISSRRPHTLSCVASGLLVMLAGFCQAGERRLLDFETAGQLHLLHPARTVRLSRESRWAAHGKYSVHWTCAPNKPWTTVELDSKLLNGWNRFNYLEITFRSFVPRSLPLAVEFIDAAGKDFATRSTYGERPKALPQVHPGINHILIDLRLARRNRWNGLDPDEITREKKIDFFHLKRVKIWFDTRAIKTPAEIFMDNLRLLSADRVAAAFSLTLPPKAIAFDFGPNTTSPPPGFTLVSPRQRFAPPSQAFGFAPDSPHPVAYPGNWPDPLTGHGVQNVSDKDPLRFQLSLPNGAYTVWVGARIIPRPGQELNLTLQGKTLFHLGKTVEDFYSNRGFFRFFGINYSEKPHALWQHYVRVLAPGYAVTCQVTNGQLSLTAQNIQLGALIIVPTAKITPPQLAAAVAADRQSWFERDIYLQRPANQPCVQSNPDAALFFPAAGSGIMPWTGMTPRDPKKLTLTATPGEVLLFCFGLRPFRDLPEARIILSDLTTAATGDKLPAATARIYLKRYISNGQKIIPWTLFPTDRIPLESGLTRAFWIQLRIPPNQAPGLYHGNIQVQLGSHHLQRPLSVRIFPLHLDHLPLAAGAFYQPPKEGQFAFFNHFPDLPFDALLDAQLRLMRELGFTSLQLPAPTVRVHGGIPQLDFSRLQKTALAARRAGLLASVRQPAPLYFLSTARQLERRIHPRLRPSPGDEFRQPDFPPAFLQAARQTSEWAKKNNIPLIFWAVDEPRQTPNPWNRTLPDTRTYCDLLNCIPELETMVTLMSDRAPGVLPLLQHLDIVATHAWKKSAAIIAATRQPNAPQLWIYNSGKSRFSVGFRTWRLNATGRFEWHFCQWIYPNHHQFYPGDEQHNPFLDYEPNALTIPAPLIYPGALLPTEALFTYAQGLTDLRYLYTLQNHLQAILAVANHPKHKTALQAQSWLADLRQQISPYPRVKKAIPAVRLNTWKSRAAVFLAQLITP